MFNLFYDAKAEIKGGKKNPSINGIVYFNQTKDGVIVTAKINNLPHSKNKCDFGIFGFHIHSGNSCTGDILDEFKDAKDHYNPEKCMHPNHAGDMPVLFENNGYAYMSFLTNRFKVKEIVGKVIIIHNMPDDFRTNPGGDSGEKIACGKIVQK